MEYRIVPLQLLQKLHKLTDEDGEANLRISIEETIKGPSLQLDDIREELRESIKNQMEESKFYF